MKRKQQKQRSEYDCVLACVSELTGKSYDDLFDSDFCDKIERSKGCYNDDITEALKRAGLERGVDYQCIYTAGNAQVKPLLWGRKAMIQVDSINYDKGMHCICWDGEEIHDPSNKQVYKWMSSVHPIYVWIFK